MAVEVATAAAGVAGRLLPKALEYLHKNHKLRAGLKDDIEHIQSEFSFISGVIAEDGDCPRWSGNNHEHWIMKVRELAHEIEDCIGRYIHRITLEKEASWIRRNVHRVKTRSTRNKFVADILRLKKKSIGIRSLRETYTSNKDTNCGRTNTNNGGINDNNNEGDSDSDINSDDGGRSSALEPGGPRPQDELMELIRESSTQGQPDTLKVISIVGFGGIGKTQLARYVYDTTGSQYDAQAWVLAAEKDSKGVLTDILQQLGRTGSTRHRLKECLGTKRFLIVIDDMCQEFWKAIQDAFPVISGVSSRVIITTIRQSIATECSDGDGHVFVVRTLDDIHSRELFVEKASLVCPPPPGLEIIKKCGGLPLALVTTARVLRGDPSGQEWADLGTNLGEELEKRKELVPMQSVLVRSYTSLGSQDVKKSLRSQDVKTFLLYMGIYPSDRPIRKGSLIRKWLAEGLISSDPTSKRSALEVSLANFKELVDRSIIQPIDASSSNGAGVKTCQSHGIMLEFIVRKSMCQNFVALLYDKATTRKNDVHWLSLHDRTAARSRNDPMDLRLVRSLTIFGKAHESFLDFSKYKLMRVLDLEQCNEQLEDKHLKKICNNLWLLRYLSLRGAARITVLPKKIKKLQLLETLDLRETGIEILPKEVLKLPYLIHLFGKFKLEQGVGAWRMDKLQTWLKENSKLETLDGFVVNSKSHQFGQLMKHMEELTKVKIWCESTADASSGGLSNVSKTIKKDADSAGNSSQLSEAIQEFIERGTHQDSLSLSLNFNDKQSQDDLLKHLSIEERLDPSRYPYLRSFKLQGNRICSQLPPFVTRLRGLSKLCLSFPGHNLSGDILAALSSAHNLWYLKLVATQLDNLTIGQDALRNLRRLCIVVEVVTGLVIGEVPLLFLESLQLLCKDLNGFRGMTIQSLPRLKEVALHAGMSEQTKPEWIEAAKNHPRRPNFLFKSIGSEPAAETSTAATASDAMVQEVAVDSGPVENSGNPAASPTDMPLPVTTSSSAISNEDSAQFVTSEMGSESAAEITPAATATGTMIQVVAVESEHVENSERPAEPPTDMPLSTTMSHNSISNGESVPVATSEIVSEPAEIIAEAPANTDNTTSSINHDAITNAQHDHPAPAVTSEIGSEPSAKIPEAPSTNNNTALSMNFDAITNAQAHIGQVDGDGQHDDHKREYVDNTHDPNDFASENGPTTSMARFKKEMEGVAV